MIQIGDVHQLGSLFLDRLEDVVISVPEGVDRQAADKVEIAIAVGVEQIDPVPALDDEFGPNIGL